MSDAGRATEGSTAPADAIRREIEHAVAFMDEALDGTAVPKRDPFRLVLKGLALNLMAMAHLADAVLDAAARVGTGPKGARTAPVDADEAQHQAEVFGLAARAGMAREASGVFRALRVQHWLAGGVAVALALALLTAPAYLALNTAMTRMHAADAAERQAALAQLNRLAQLGAADPMLAGALEQLPAEQRRALTAVLLDRPFVDAVLAMDARQRLGIVQGAARARPINAGQR